MERLADIGLVVAANAWNLLLVGVFLARAGGSKRLEWWFGLASVALALPIAAVALANAVAQRPWWAVALPAAIVIFLLVELVLDYVLRLEFRRTWLLGPYLLVFYAAQWAAIGYGFAVDRLAGVVTLATYFVCLAATAYSYSRVGHGETAAAAPATR